MLTLELYLAFGESYYRPMSVGRIQRASGLVHSQLEPRGTPAAMRSAVCDAIIDDPATQLVTDNACVTCEDCRHIVAEADRAIEAAFSKGRS